MQYRNESIRDVNDGDPALLSDIPRISEFDHAERDSTPLVTSTGTSLGLWTRRIVIATAVWSVCELPFEIAVIRTMGETAACILGKVLWVALVAFVLAGSRLARIAYAFLCAIGLTAIACSLPVEFRVFPLGFLLSSVECVLKAVALICFVSGRIFAKRG
ncbi:hypothetical protein LJR267_010158 [Paraburkholderia hospita]|jgi:hypothetical protein|uniref:hypothetical protein n=1 Tax=Paraburkholderia hospita TaxID=169430 RepID=UPI003ECC4AD5